MTVEANLKILVAVTGGIAAYKSAELVRLFVKAGADVQVLMTEGAQAFVTPLTFQALTGKAVRSSLLDPAAELGMGHIELARWADHIVIAPATADSLARLSQGMANDLLTTVILAYQGPVTIAPAMNQAMWSNVITQDNIKRLSAFHPHWSWVGPDAGEQACGDVGPGRMSSPEAIAHQVLGAATDKTLTGKRVVISAGPTRERLDPVRYISNFSSGKMGYALAQAAQQAGADVVLVSGPVALQVPKGVRLVSVESAQDMHDAVMKAAVGSDLFIATAAVADYRPETTAAQKMKKSDKTLSRTIDLVENPDIVASVARLTTGRPFVVGFAAETHDAVAYGQDKRVKKQLDMVVINDVSVPGLGFGSDDNQVTLVSSEIQESYGPAAKIRIAQWLIEKIADHL
jgi:phosphopantothenoylcysteine decarboxylase/phosphopantothenate--cysteine ligase